MLLLVACWDVRAAMPEPSVRLEEVSSYVTQLLETIQRDPSSVSVSLAGLEETLEAALQDRAATGQVRAGLLRAKWLHYLHQNRHREGVALLEEAIFLLESDGADEALLMDYYRDLSYSHVQLGEFNRAKGYLRRCIVSSYRGDDRVQLSRDLFSIADAHLKTGDLDIAARYFSQVRDLNENSDDFLVAIAGLKLGTIDRMRGDVDAALGRHTRALGFFEERGMYRSLVAKLELAQDYWLKGNIDQTRNLAYTVFSDPRSFIEQKLDAVLLLMETADSDQAFERWQSRAEEFLAGSASSMGSAVSNPMRRVQFSRLSIERALRTDDAGAFREYGDRGMAVIEHVVSELLESSDDQFAFLANVQDFVSVYVEGLADLRAYDELLTLLERLAIYETPLVSTRSGVSLEELDTYLAAEKQVLDFNQRFRAEPSEENRLQLAEAQRERDLRRDFYLGVSSRGETVSIRLPEVAREDLNVPEGDLALRFYVQENVSFVLAADTVTTRLTRLPGRQALREMISTALVQLESINGRGPEETSQALQALADALLPSNPGDYRRLVLVADDLVHQVPFSALLSLRADGLSMPVVRTPSLLAYYSMDENPAVEGPPSIVVFADPAFAGADFNRTPSEYRNWVQGLGRLPHTAREAGYIKSSYPEGAVKLLLGQDATRAGLLSEDSRRAKILHIATHGYFSPETPDVVGLATAPVPGIDDDGGFLSLTRLLQEKFYSNLVVISACETMLGRSYEGVGVKGLAYGLLANGASSVLGTLWKVPDRPTAEFMRTFYSKLKSNRGDAALSLAETKQDFVASRRFSHPFYWSGFVLMAKTRTDDRSVFRERPVDG